MVQSMVKEQFKGGEYLGCGLKMIFNRCNRCRVVVNQSPSGRLLSMDLDNKWDLMV